MTKKLFVIGLTLLCFIPAAAAQEDALAGYWKGVIQADVDAADKRRVVHPRGQGDVK